MMISDIKKAYEAMRDHMSDGLPKMNLGSFERDSQIFSKPESVWQAIQNTEPQQGWLLCQSYQGHFEQGLPSYKSDWGHLIAAEWVDRNQNSYQLHCDGQTWFINRFIHQKGADHLYDELEQDIHGGQRRLKYRRYWQFDKEQGLIQIQACLIGVVHA